MIYPIRFKVKFTFLISFFFASITVIAQNENVNLPDSATFCEGDSVMLDAGAHQSFNWNTGDTSQTIFVSSTGNYAVTVLDTNGTFIDSTWVYEIFKPIANFTDSVDHFTVAFTNFSQNADSFLWDFGDSTTSNQVHPIHLYPWTPSALNCYNVILYAYNSCGVDSFSQINHISNIGSYNPSFNAQVSGLSAAFSFNSLNPISYVWYFGDGDSSTVANPTHVYSPTEVFGCYIVTLKVETDCGTEYITKRIAVGDYPANNPCNIISGVKNNQIATSSIDMYPNPNNGVFNVIVKTTEATEMSVEVMDARGSLVYTNSFGTVNGEVNRAINMEGAAPGIYFVKVILNGETGVYRLVVK